MALAEARNGRKQRMDTTVTLTIRFRVDEQENILSARLYELDADGLLERPLKAATLDELRPECAKAIREYIAETGELVGEVEIG